MIFCKICNSEFMPITSANKICSDRCRKVSLKERTVIRLEKTKRQRAKIMKKYRDSNPIRFKIRAICSKSKYNGIPFDLTEEDIIIPDICPVLGIPLDGKTRDRGWSVDRIVPEKGYVKSNIRIISMRANRLKSDASLLDVENILKYMKENT